MYVTRKCLQVVDRLLCAQISRAQNVLDFSRNEQLPKLCRNGTCTMWNVQISNNKHELQMTRPDTSNIYQIYLKFSHTFTRCAGNMTKQTGQKNHTISPNSLKPYNFYSDNDDMSNKQDYTVSHHYVVSAETSNTFKNLLDKFWPDQELLYDYKAYLLHREPQCCTLSILCSDKVVRRIVILSDTETTQACIHLLRVMMVM